MNNYNIEEFAENQKRKLSKIVDYLQNNENHIFDKYFIKYNIKGVRKDYRYGWLKWLQLDFNDFYREQLKPYVGLQIYP